jgi:hypothetical protein
VFVLCPAHAISGRESLSGLNFSAGPLHKNMHGWTELSSYNALQTFLCGTATALSFWGLGHLVCGRVLRATPAFLKLPAECVAGVLTVSLIVQGLAICNASSVSILQGLWIAAVGGGVVALATALASRRAVAEDAGQPLTAGWLWIPAAVMGAVLLLAAVAPESRSDEMAYHALASARLLTDGGLHFYPLPWEASAVAQLIWHFAVAPVYAECGTAAAGVTSAWLALVLALSVGRLVQWQSGSWALGAVGAFLALAGGYSLIFFSTTGPHAFGYLSVFVAVSAAGWSGEIRQTAGLPAYALAVALGCAGAIAGKVTMLPAVALITGFAALDILGGTSDARRRLVLLVPLVAIPMLAIGPLLVWTWASSGSPLGVLTAKLFHGAPFDAETLAAYEGTRELFASSFQWRFETAYWSLPSVLCALAALVLEPSRQRRTRWWLIAGCQVLVIVLLLPKEIRHLGGIQYPLLASGMAALASRAMSRGHSDRKVAFAGALAAAPWALFVLWIGTIYLPLTSGRVSAPEFLRRYSGLQSDYEALDKLLPPDASLLIGRSRSDAMQYGWYARPPIYYAPRPVLFHTSEVQQRQHVYLLFVGAGAEGAHGPIPVDPWLPAGYFLGRSVYSNPQARFYPSRTPGGNAGLARVDVLELVRQP